MVTVVYGSLLEWVIHIHNKIMHDPRFALPYRRRAIEHHQFRKAPGRYCSIGGRAAQMARAFMAEVQTFVDTDDRKTLKASQQSLKSLLRPSMPTFVEV